MTIAPVYHLGEIKTFRMWKYPVCLPTPRNTNGDRTDRQARADVSI